MTIEVVEFDFKQMGNNSLYLTMKYNAPEYVSERDNYIRSSPEGLLEDGLRALEELNKDRKNRLFRDY